MNRSRLAALSAGAMFLVASVLAPAVATADTGSTNTIKVLNAPTFNPPVSSGSFTVNVVANGAVPISGAGTGITFDQTKLQLTAIAKDATEVANGVAYAGFPSSGTLAAFLSNANSSGSIPVVAWSYTDGLSNETANADHGIFSLTFSVIAQGDNTIGVATGLTGGVLDGTTGATYGAGLPVTPVNGTVHNSFQPIWSLSAPASATVLTGATSTGYTVSTSVSQGTPGAISFAASGLPSGVSAAFNPTSVTNAGTTQLTFTATGAAAIASSTVTITATDASNVSHSANISLQVVGNNDFGISTSPTSISVNGGATSGAVTVSTSVLTGTPGTIALSTSALPTGVTAAFTPASVAAGSSSSLTFSADNTATSGVTSVTITGNNGTYSRTATVTLNVIVITGVGANVNVTGTLDNGFLGLTCPSSLSIALLRGNTNQLNVPCQVYANTVWNLNVNDTATDAYKGYMVTGRPVNDANPTGPFHLADSMHVLADQYIDVAGNAAYHNNVDLASGGTALSGSNSASAPLVLSQFVRASAQPGSYGIQVLFSAVSVF